MPVSTECVAALLSFRYPSTYVCSNQHFHFWVLLIKYLGSSVLISFPNLHWNWRLFLSLLVTCLSRELYWLISCNFKATNCRYFSAADSYVKKDVTSKKGKYQECASWDPTTTMSTSNAVRKALGLIGQATTLPAHHFFYVKLFCRQCITRT